MSTKTDFINEVKQIFSKFKTPAIEYFDKIDLESSKIVIDKFFESNKQMTGEESIEKLKQMTNEKEIVEIIFFLSPMLFNPITQMMLITSSKEVFIQMVKKLYF